MKYNRSISELEKNAVLWWPEVLSTKNSTISIIPQLLKSQDDFLDILSLAKENPSQVFDILKKCIWEVHHGDVIHNRVDISDEDIEEFIDNFTTEQFEMVIKFFDTMPKLRHEVEVTNPKTQVKSKVTIEGLDNFLE